MSHGPSEIQRIDASNGLSATELTSIVVELAADKDVQLPNDNMIPSVRQGSGLRGVECNSKVSEVRPESKVTHSFHRPPNIPLKQGLALRPCSIHDHTDGWGRKPGRWPPWPEYIERASEEVLAKFVSILSRR